jgi:hypothetical protein
MFQNPEVRDKRPQLLRRLDFAIPDHVPTY